MSSFLPSFTSFTRHYLRTPKTPPFQHNTTSKQNHRHEHFFLVFVVKGSDTAPDCDGHVTGTSARSIPSRPSSGPSTMVLGNVDSSPSSSSSLLLSPPELRKNRWYSRDQHRGVFGRKEVKNCLPKGFRHTSAPSRYVNYQPLGSCA
ncbi:hypothetical protein LINPERHAP1_LOCUS33709 [Linum perenne]